MGGGGDYSWRGFNFHISLHLCLLTISGASLPCVCVFVRYQVEGVESKKVNKKKNCDVPRIQCKRGWCMVRRACLAQFYKKFFLGSRLLDLERNHCFCLILVLLDFLWVRLSGECCYCTRIIIWIRYWVW